MVTLLLYLWDQILASIMLALQGAIPFFLGLISKYPLFALNLLPAMLFQAV